MICREEGLMARGGGALTLCERVCPRKVLQDLRQVHTKLLRCYSL